LRVFDRSNLKTKYSAAAKDEKKRSFSVHARLMNELFTQSAQRPVSRPWTFLRRRRLTCLSHIKASTLLGSSWRTSPREPAAPLAAPALRAAPARAKSAHPASAPAPVLASKLHYRHAVNTANQQMINDLYKAAGEVGDLNRTIGKRKALDILARVPMPITLSNIGAIKKATKGVSDSTERDVSVTVGLPMSVREFLLLPAAPCSSPLLPHAASYSGNIIRR
jgi:hypothetical protein